MCTLTVLYRPGLEYPLLMVGNRDERYSRPTAGPAVIALSLDCSLSGSTNGSFRVRPPTRNAIGMLPRNAVYSNPPPSQLASAAVNVSVEGSV